MIKDFLKLFTKAAEPTPYSVQFMSPGTMNGAPPRLGTADLLQAYSQMPWLRAIVNKVGKSVGITQWRLYAITGGVGDKDFVRPLKLQRCRDTTLRRRYIKGLEEEGNLKEIDDHPLLDLLYNPNSELDSIINFQLIQQYMDLVGEAYWLIEKDGLGLPRALWPLPPSWVKALPSKNRPTYRISIESFTEVEIPMSEIIKFYDPDPVNPYGRGSGIAKSLGDELETDEFAAKHLKNFFFNRARPDLIISGDSLSREDTKRLEEKWLQKHQGFWNSFKPHFLSRKVDIKELGQSFGDMQLVELRKHERDTCIQVYGIPPEKLGVINESKRATISAADLFWTKDILLPRVEVIRTVIQDQLIPLYDERLLIDFESPVVQDQELQLKMMNASAWAYSINEWRLANGFPEVGGEIGDMHIMPSNSVLVAKDGKITQLTAPKEPASGEDGDKPNEDGEKPTDSGENEDEKPENEDEKLLENEISSQLRLASIGGELVKYMEDHRDDITKTARELVVKNRKLRK